MKQSDLKAHLISAGVTFVSMFFTLLGTEIAINTPILWTQSIITALVLAAIRGAFKATFETFLAPKKDTLPEWIDRG